jgi:hypothetical protein
VKNIFGDEKIFSGDEKLGIKESFQGVKESFWGMNKYRSFLKYEISSQVEAILLIF